MPRLIIFDESVRGVDLPREPLIIGRSKKSDIPIHDRILSRKHCAVIPVDDSGFRLVDLKSSYGTYLNGQRIEREELSFDDVIEIGSTVMVYLDTQAWNRGEGLARLRNPVKAQELVHRLNVQTQARHKIPIEKMSAVQKKSRKRRNVIDMLPVLIQSGSKDGVSTDDLLDLLVDYASFKALSLWIRRRPDLKRVVAGAVERAMVTSLSGGWREFQDRLREEIRDGLEARGLSGEQAESSATARGADATDDDTPLPEEPDDRDSGTDDEPLGSTSDEHERRTG